MVFVENQTWLVKLDFMKANNRKLSNLYQFYSNNESLQQVWEAVWEFLELISTLKSVLSLAK